MSHNQTVITAARLPRQARQIINLVSEAIMIAECKYNEPSNQQIIYVNEAFETLFGYEYSEILNEKPSLLYGYESYGDALSSIYEVGNEEDDQKASLYLRSKSGNYLWVDVQITVKTINHKTQQAHFYYTFQDATELRAIESKTKALQDKKQQYHMALSRKIQQEALSKKLMELVVDTSEVLRFHYKAKEFMEQAFHADDSYFFSVDNTEEEQALFIQFFKDLDQGGGTPILCEDLLADELSVASVPLLNEYGISSLIMAPVVDVQGNICDLFVLTYSFPKIWYSHEVEWFEASVQTIGMLVQYCRSMELIAKSQKEALVWADDYKALYEKELKLNALKENFLATMSHECKTPLAIMHNTLQLMGRDNSLSAIYEERYFAKLNRSVARMTELVDGVLSLRHLDEVDKLNSSNLKCNPLDVLHSVIEQAQSLYPNVRFLIRNHCRTQSIAIEESKLHVIYNNIIVNACKYSNKNGKVFVFLFVDNKELKFLVRDAGIGIAAEDIPKIFENFFRCENAIVASGTGVGLHITKALIEQMGGAISVKSKLDIGTSFKVILPMNREESTS